MVVDQSTKHMLRFLHGALFYMHNPHAGTAHVPYLFSRSLRLAICCCQFSLAIVPETAWCIYIYIFLFFGVHFLPPPPHTHIFSPVIPKIVPECELIDNTCSSWPYNILERMFHAQSNVCRLKFLLI